MSEQTKNEVVLAELEQVRALNPEGLLKAETAVAWARQNKESALYRHIDQRGGWDDTKAAESWRAEIVRQLIRVVVIQSNEIPQQVRAYVSQPSDRISGGGYRPTEEALAKARQELVNDALRQMEKLGNRYTHLPELKGMFEEVGRLVMMTRLNLTKKEAS